MVIHFRYSRMSIKRRSFLSYTALLLVTSCCGMAVLEKPGESRVCDGTNVQLSTIDNHSHHIGRLRLRYENCTYVQGNLEISDIRPDDDLKFLSQIREVTGYVLISQVKKDFFPLPKLRIIRGRTLFDHNGRKYALWVTLSDKLRELSLPSLQEIMRGDVLFMANPLLCHVDKTIDWSDIFADNRTQILDVEVDDHHPERKCAPCNELCESGLCWGASNSSCQKRTKNVCASQCQPGRCFRDGPRDCCHKECVAGCYGPLATNCFACKVFDHDGTCVQECPTSRYYDQETMTWKRKEDQKLAYGNTCVKKCPDNMLQDDGACVRECPEGKVANNGTCTTCDGPCPKKCRGFGKLNTDPKKKSPLNFITQQTLQGFINCTIIEGDLQILSQTFLGAMEFADDTLENAWHDGIEPADLEKLSTVKEITGYLRIDATHPDMRNLSFLRNLEVIQGRNLEDKFSLTIATSQYLTSLALDSLKRVVGGGVRILENRDLCFADTVAWGKLTASNVPVLARNNRPRETCKEAGEVCHLECSLDGCWGKGPNQCLTCANYKFEKTCVANCNSQPLLYDSGNATCMSCYSQCRGGCSGPGADNCTSCLNVKDGNLCKPTCPITKFKDQDGICQPCSSMCSYSTVQVSTPLQGCTGSGDYVGFGGCRSCERGVLTRGNSSELVVECLPPKTKDCPRRHYMQHPGLAEAKELDFEAMAGKVLCRPCHPLCEKCQSDGLHCDECVFFKEDERCVANCTSGTHYQHPTKKICLPCHSECSPKYGCSGPLSTQCGKCKNKRDYYDQDGRFNCTSTCPEERQFSKQDGEVGLDGSEAVCTVENVEEIERHERKKKNILLGCGIGFPLAILLIITWMGLCIRKERTKKKSLKLISEFAVIEDREPFTPTDVKPNTSKLRIINEKELRRGKVLGQGAFGFVYQGVLVLSQENKRIPVAIKQLKDGFDITAEKDLLEEARNSANARCPYLVPLIGVCMTTPTIIVTQLLPLGCLLDYVKKNRNQISSKNFLNWCSQIALGMKYLEDARMIHRDLAARNVLVQTPNWVRVTDFGLAKILGDKESHHKAGSGRMPVKWLAPECIQESIYTHKTDVWAFGITAWEILTYGEKPWDQIPAKNLLEKLLEGERLPQPSICTVDVYYLMVKCWSANPHNRPAFSELASEFGKMVRDPGRYLTIPHDKYLRLPEYKDADEQRMLRECDDHGQEELVIYDDYMSPHFRYDAGQTGTMKKQYQNGHIMANGNIPQNWQHSSLPPQFSHVSAPTDTRTAWSVDRKDSPPHSRYAMDPVKGVPKLYGDTPGQIGNGKGSGVLVGLDDYLIPSDHSPTTNEAYLDLTESLIKERDASLVKDYQKMPLVSGRRPSGTPKLYSGFPYRDGKGVPVVMVNNPEYHLSSGASDASTESAPSQTASNTPLAPDDEESDHEYYNDFGLEQRRGEMIPLNHKPRRNETTV